MSDDLVLKIGGQTFTGWTEIEVERGIERMPNTFKISATEDNPVSRGAAGIQKGSACTVSLGSDLVLTGSVNIVAPAIGPGQHALTIQGRGKCQDLTDCSAEWPNCQISGSNALEIAQKLAKPYGITVKNLGPAGPTVPQFNINVAETPAEILELITRHAQLLYYEAPDGNLILAQAGTVKAASGFAEGQNIQAGSAVYSDAEQYSDYTVSLLSVNSSPLLVDNDSLYYANVKNPNVTRHRKLVTVAEGVPGGQELAQKRAVWDMNRRAGRGRAIRVTADSWRDKAGKLWEPNTLAPVTSPRLRAKEPGLCIASVIYRLGEGGKTSEVMLMPKEAFLPEPILLQPVIFGLTPAGS